MWFGRFGSSVVLRDTYLRLTQINPGIGRDIGIVFDANFVQVLTKSETASIEFITGDGIEWNALLFCPNNECLANFWFGEKLTIIGYTYPTPHVYIRISKPFFGEEEFTVNPATQAVFRQRQKDTNLALVNLAAAPIVLPSSTGALFASLIVSAFIQDQDASLCKMGMIGNVLPYHLVDVLGGPGRFTDVMMHVLFRYPSSTADVGYRAVDFKSE